MSHPTRRRPFARHPGCLQLTLTHPPTHRRFSPRLRRIVQVELLPGPTSPTLLQPLKGTIPFPDRLWDPTRRCWWVHPRHLSPLKTLAKRYAEAWLNDGSFSINLHTRERREQLLLFESQAPSPTH